MRDLVGDLDFAGRFRLPSTVAIDPAGEPDRAGAPNLVQRRAVVPEARDPGTGDAASASAEGRAVSRESQPNPPPATWPGVGEAGRHEVRIGGFSAGDSGTAIVNLTCTPTP